ncbi:class I SAM-dependent methyltransferase [Devosia sp.]|uniref:class I SAM-dependent methyltransferase n=1 Tax=Devosia sp. TaxID=1871048 RepID=UPI003BAC670E
MSPVSAQDLADAAEDYAYAVANCAGCTDYHATRPYLVLSGERMGAERDKEQFGALASGLFPASGDLLIAGAADAGLLEFALDVLGTRLHQVHVADLCPSPLHASERLAKRRSAPLTTFVRDLTAAAPFGSYDMIIAHLILHFMPPAGRLRYLRLLQQMLKPGGVVIVATSGGRLVPRAPGDHAQQILDALAERHISLPATVSELRARIASIVNRPPTESAMVDLQHSDRNFDPDEFRTSGAYEAAGLRIVDVHKFHSDNGGRTRRRTYTVAKAAP